MRKGGEALDAFLPPLPQRLEEYGKRYLRNQRKYVQKSQRSQRVEDTERQLYQLVRSEISENDKRWNRSSIQDWLNLTPHCPPPLELWLQLPQLESWMAKIQENRLLKFIYSAEALSSNILLGQSERKKKQDRNIKLDKRGREQKMPPQPTKIRTILPTKSGSRRCRAAALSGC